MPIELCPGRSSPCDQTPRVLQLDLWRVGDSLPLQVKFAAVLAFKSLVIESVIQHLSLKLS